ncbi:MAG: DNA polymerase III subunit epsilon [Gammaproteobacteria bacterium]|nr:DNA polymerase III subunit epsilon [Gammaproteobacteria bacterium]
MVEAGRQVVLDTETTGMNKLGVHYEGHRVIEIGCYELVNRKPTGRRFHQYLNPGRPVDPEAVGVHGITDEMLADKPPFATVAAEFLEFIDGSELIIHNAAFDVGFLDQELRLSGVATSVAELAKVTDTLVMARSLHPGQKNNLDALCKRYHIDNGHRTFHGALLDAEILADVYLAMTGGQTTLNLAHEGAGSGNGEGLVRLAASRPALRVIRASDAELAAHQESLKKVDKKSGGALWHQQ